MIYMFYMAATGPSWSWRDYKEKRRPHCGRPSSFLTLKKFLGLGFGLLETKAAASFLPFPALLEEVDALETLQDVALRDDLAGTLKRCMLAHFLLFLSIAGKYIISRRRFQPPFGVRPLFRARLPFRTLRSFQALPRRKSRPSELLGAGAGTCIRLSPLCWPCEECPAGIPIPDFFNDKPKTYCKYRTITPLIPEWYKNLNNYDNIDLKNNNIEDESR